MPPTFLLFFGLILYFGLVAIALVVCIPMLFLNTARVLAKKILITVLISFPCLMIVGFLFGIVFLIPALVLSWLASNHFISEIAVAICSITGVLIFALLVGSFALYLWYFLSRVIYQRLDKEPVLDFLEKDRVYKCIKPLLIKMRMVNDIPLLR